MKVIECPEAALNPTVVEPTGLEHDEWTVLLPGPGYLSFDEAVAWAHTLDRGSSFIPANFPCYTPLSFEERVVIPPGTCVTIASVNDRFVRGVVVDNGLFHALVDVDISYTIAPN